MANTKADRIRDVLTRSTLAPRVESRLDRTGGSITGYFGSADQQFGSAADPRLKTGIFQLVNTASFPLIQRQLAGSGYTAAQGWPVARMEQLQMGVQISANGLGDSAESTLAIVGIKGKPINLTGKTALAMLRDRVGGNKLIQLKAALEVAGYGAELQAYEQAAARGEKHPESHFLNLADQQSKHDRAERQAALAGRPFRWNLEADKYAAVGHTKSATRQALGAYGNYSNRSAMGETYDADGLYARDMTKEEMIEKLGDMGVSVGVPRKGDRAAAAAARHLEAFGVQAGACDIFGDGINPHVGLSKRGSLKCAKRDMQAISKARFEKNIGAGAAQRGAEYWLAKDASAFKFQRRVVLDGIKIQGKVAQFAGVVPPQVFAGLDRNLVGFQIAALSATNSKDRLDIAQTDVNGTRVPSMSVGGGEPSIVNNQQVNAGALVAFITRFADATGYNLVSEAQQAKLARL